MSELLSLECELTPLSLPQAKDGNEAQNEVARHIVPFNGFMCKLCSAYMKDKAARAEHLKDEGHKQRVAEFDAAAAAPKPETVTVAAVPAAATVAPAAVPVVAPEVTAVDPVPAAAVAETTTPAVEQKLPVKEEAAAVAAAPTPTPATGGTGEKTCGCSQATA